MAHDLPLELLTSAALGTASILGALRVQAASTDPSTLLWQQLGVAGALVFGAYFMIRYFMAELAKKDLVNADNTKALITHIERGYQVQLEAAAKHLQAAQLTASALDRISTAIETANLDRRHRDTAE